MSIGYDVNKGTIDQKVGQTVLQVRSAFSMVETFAKWLQNHPKGDTDPLETIYGYTSDEAYALRFYFESLDTFRLNNQNVFDTGRKMTGLE